jgi:hypothetical protein
MSTEPVLVNVFRAQESIPPAYVALRASTTNRVVVPVRQAGNRFLGSLNGLQVQALGCLFTILCRASVHSFFIDCQSLRELRITSVLMIAAIQKEMWVGFKCNGPVNFLREEVFQIQPWLLWICGSLLRMKYTS